MRGKQITQETFDATVKENIDEFEMSWEDALADAVHQFEALGVDLHNIVTTKPTTTTTITTETVENCPTNDADETGAGNAAAAASSSTSSTERTYSSSKAINLIERLRQASEQPNTKTILDTLSEMTAECNLGLAQRCLLASHGATPLLFSTCNDDRSHEIKLAVLRTLVAMTNGQPDVLTHLHMDRAMSLCCVGDLDAETLGAVLRLIRNGCVKHEANRQYFVDRGLIPQLLHLMSARRHVADIVQVIAATLRSLTLDDDVRVPFGRAHQHAKMIVADHGGLKILLDVATLYVDDTSTLIKVLSTLSSVAVRNEFCQAIVNDGGLPLVLKAMLENVSTQPIVKVGLQLLKTIAGNDSVKSEIVKSGGVHVVLDAMSRHQTDVGVCQVGCACLAALALRSPDNCRIIVESGGANAIVAAMKVHRNDIVTLKSSYRAVTNLVNRTKEHVNVFVELGVESSINEARRRHGAALDGDANALLFLLGLKAEMRELWTGEKGQIDN